jgi:predicted metal-dependent hydrolase
MLRPHRFDDEIDPGPVQIQARKVHFAVSGIGLHWIPGHPVASNVISLLNVVLPAAERWFVDTLNEALPLVKDPHLAEDIRGFIGQEAMHADVHEQVLHEYLVVNGIDPKPMLDQVEYAFEKVLAPTTSTDPKRRLNHLCDRLWLIAAIEHYTAVLGDFALNCAWDDHNADPTMVDLFRWHGSEEVEHRMVAHDVAVYFHDSYVDRIRAMTMSVVMVLVFFQRGVVPGEDGPHHRHRLVEVQPAKDARLEARPASQVPQAVWLHTAMYFKPGFSPEEMGSTAQAVAYLASSPAARAAHL